MSIILGLLGAAISARSANKAASAQKRSARDQIAYSEQTRDMIREDLRPFYESGVGANAALNYLAGLGDQPEGYAGFSTTPGYEFRRGEAMDAVSGMAAANGSLNSGRVMKALQGRADGLASAEYGNYINMLAGLAGSGQNAAAGMGTAATNTMGQVNNAYGAMGNASAAGAIATGNAWNQGIGNVMGQIGYQKALNGGQGGAVGNMLFGGPGLGMSWG